MFRSGGSANRLHILLLVRKSVTILCSVVFFCAPWWQQTTLYLEVQEGLSK